MVIVQVATVQVGWISVTVGATGVAGWVFMVTEVAAEIQPAAFFTVTL